jgi:hypothetical protein
MLAMAVGSICTLIFHLLVIKIKKLMANDAAPAGEESIGTAMTSPCDGFSLAVSGMMMPPASKKSPSSPRSLYWVIIESEMSDL